ncbi:uncharacterized protein LOC110459842 [Mizuhopecten yessoensis]|uniref:uncharacterized protein LOC110459842 n=1 Tax=Mizuhopecten yessoensis TaxID=6573 RepID=UPI000B45DB6B|nr:uncharacterized protein LOC110459842 [Mizuhopecten yessoensis]
MSCCGVDSYRDLSLATNWGKTYKDKSIPLTGKIIGLHTPLVCCKKTERDKLGSGAAASTVGVCATNPATTTSNFENGCYDAVWDEIDKSKTAVILILSAIIAFQAVMIFFSLWLARAIRKENQVGPVG